MRENMVPYVYTYTYNARKEGRKGRNSDSSCHDSNSILRTEFNHNKKCPVF